jgi:hypothetical protein
MSYNCPTCGQVLPWKKAKTVIAKGQAKLLQQDLAKADSSISALLATIANPKRLLFRSFADSFSTKETQSLIESCQSEIRRLTKAKEDHSLLWRIYRRGYKGQSVGY